MCVSLSVTQPPSPPPPPCRPLHQHGRVRQERGHAGQLRGQHGAVPGAVSAGRSGGQDGAAAPGSGLQRLLRVCRAAGRLHPAAGRRASKRTAVALPALLTVAIPCLGTAAC